MGLSGAWPGLAVLGKVRSAASLPPPCHMGPLSLAASPGWAIAYPVTSIKIDATAALSQVVRQLENLNRLRDYPVNGHGDMTSLNNPLYPASGISPSHH